MLDKTPTTRLQALLDTFGAALEAGRIDDAVNQFAEDCYWRDLVAFTWNLKTVEGRDQVRDMLQVQLSTAKPSNWRVAAGEEATEADGVLESWITFETATGRGYGLVRFKNGQIWTLLTALAELKGHEEKSGFTRPLGAKHGQDLGAKTWAEEREEEARTLGYEKQPYTVIIGGGRVVSPLAPGCGSSAYRPSSSKRTSGPVIAGANATSRSACTILSGTTTCPISTFRRTGRSLRRRTRSGTGWNSTAR